MGFCEQTRWFALHDPSTAAAVILARTTHQDRQILYVRGKWPYGGQSPTRSKPACDVLANVIKACEHPYPRALTSVAQGCTCLESCINSNENQLIKISRSMKNKIIREQHRERKSPQPPGTVSKLSEGTYIPTEHEGFASHLSLALQF